MACWSTSWCCLRLNWGSDESRWFKLPQLELAPPFVRPQSQPASQLGRSLKNREGAELVCVCEGALLGGHYMRPVVFRTFPPKTERKNLHWEIKWFLRGFKFSLCTTVPISPAAIKHVCGCKLRSFPRFLSFLSKMTPAIAACLSTWGRQLRKAPFHFNCPSLSHVHSAFNFGRILYFELKSTFWSLVRVGTSGFIRKAPFAMSINCTGCCCSYCHP